MTENKSIPSVWDVPEIFRKRLGERPGRQRVMEAEGHMLLILHRAALPDEVTRKPAFFWRKPDGEWLSDQQGSGEAGLDTLLDEFDGVFESCENLELNAKQAEDYFEVLERSAPVIRTVRHLHVVLQEARKSVSDDRKLINWRDRAYEIERRGELLYNGAKNALDYAVAKRAEEQAITTHQMAVSSHRLNVLVAFFFPIATMSAIFGVNLKFGFEESSPPWPFLAVMTIGIIFGGLLTLFVLPTSPKK